MLVCCCCSYVRKNVGCGAGVLGGILHGLTIVSTGCGVL